MFEIQCTDVDFHNPEEDNRALIRAGAINSVVRCFITPSRAMVERDHPETSIEYARLDASIKEAMIGYENHTINRKIYAAMRCSNRAEFDRVVSMGIAKRYSFEGVLVNVDGGCEFCVPMSFSDFSSLVASELKKEKESKT